MGTNVARILPPEEWPRVNTPELAPSIRYAQAHQASIVVVEEGRLGGEIVATLTVMPITHYENAWIKESNRGNAGIIRAMLRVADQVAVNQGARWALWGAADNDNRMQDMLQSRGDLIPARFWAMKIGG